LRVLPIVAIGCLGYLAGACAAKGDGQTGSAESAHTAGELVWQNSPYLWNELSRADMDRSSGDDSAPEGNPVEARMQAWVDRFDDVVRKVVKEKYGSDLRAPKPKVRIVLDRDANAYIAPRLTCLMQTAAPPASGSLMAFFQGLRERDMRFIPSGCMRSRSWAPGQDGVDWFNEQLGREAITVAADGIRVAGHDEVAQRVGVFATANYVNVFSGLAEWNTEKGAAVVLAHELGHYYRTHGATPIRENYTFWYDRDRVLPERPTPVADQAAYMDQYRKLRVPRYLVPGQTIHARIGSTLVAWTKDITVASGHACEGIPKLRATWRQGLADEFFTESVRDLSSVARREYLKLEQAWQTCIEAVKLTDDDSASAPADSMWTSNSVPRSWFTSRLEIDLPAVPTPQTAPLDTLTGLMKELDAAAKQLDAEAPAFLKRLENNHIGLYTVEQEADDLSMDLATRVGITPQDVFEMRLASVKRRDPVAGAECEALYKKGFRDAEGNEIYVPLGTLQDPHHADCYRLYNVYRENEAHHYQTAPANFPATTTPWADIQKAAREMIVPVITPLTPQPGTTPQPSPSPAPAPPPTKGSTTDPPPSAADPETPEATKPASSHDAGCAVHGGTFGTSGTSDGISAMALLGIGLILSSRRRRSEPRG
jgi:hypothetical protein